MLDRKSTRLNSSHTVIYTLSYTTLFRSQVAPLAHEGTTVVVVPQLAAAREFMVNQLRVRREDVRSEEHTSELQSHRDLHSFLHDALPISGRATRSRRHYCRSRPPARRGSRVHGESVAREA